MIQKWLIRIVAISTVVISANSSASDRISPSFERKLGSVSLCVGRDANGYNWVGDDWKRTGFKASKYIIRKVPSETDSDSTFPINTCPGDMQEKADHVYEDNVSLHRCYVVAEPGKDPMWRETCSEYYVGGKLHSVSCDLTAISFRPNGRFLRYSEARDIREASEVDSKDSVFVEHGECSDI